MDVDVIALKTSPPVVMRQKPMASHSPYPDDWAPEDNLYLLRYAGGASFSTEFLEFNKIIGLWFQSQEPARHIDDLAMIFGAPDPTPDDFQKSFWIRKKINRALNDQATVGIAFDPQSNLREVATMTTSLTAASEAENLRLAANALRRLRRRSSEDIGDWADRLSKDLGIHRD